MTSNLIKPEGMYALVNSNIFFLHTFVNHPNDHLEHMVSINVLCFQVQKNKPLNCTCRDGFAGRLCETALKTPCNPDPCSIGQLCKTSGQTFICQCKSNSIRWEGKTARRGLRKCNRLH